MEAAEAMERGGGAEDDGPVGLLQRRVRLMQPLRMLLLLSPSLPLLSLNSGMSHVTCPRDMSHIMGHMT